MLEQNWSEQKRRAYDLRYQGMTQQDAARQLGISTRTLRRWEASPAWRAWNKEQHDAWMAAWHEQIRTRYA